jgi:hypothetical protein
MMNIRAITKRNVELSAPHYYGYEVYFGFMPDSNMGALAPLSRKIVIRKWLAENAISTLIKVEPHRVVFDNEDDAALCYLAFK